MRQLVLDTETTGLRTEDGHRIIEIACVELINRKLTGQRYHQHINPQREIDKEAFAVHGISNDFLQDKPLFSAISKDFIAFVEGADLIIHNAPFDVGFINYELSLIQAAAKPITKYCQVIDTLAMARQLHIGQRNSLDALCKRYGIDNSQRNLHGALLDANLLAQVYLAMTGGQSSLFGESLAAVPVMQKTKSPQRTVANVGDLKVIMANAEELAAHEMKLNKMAEKAGCLWQD